MQNVSVNGKKFEVRGETPLKLANGSLVLHYNRLGDVMGAYIVTSFRDHHNKYGKDSTTGYCSLVDLDDGYIKFEERCSRTTTMARVLSHLNPNDYEAKQALKDGQYIEVHTNGNYKIDLSTKVVVTK